MQNSISYWQHFLLQETEEKELSPKQQKIAKLDPPADKIDAGDFKKLRAGAKIEEKTDDSDWKVGEEIIGGKKHYFLYNQETGKRKGTYKSKEEAQKNIKEDVGKTQDHEVSMANNSIETIIKAAMELKAKLGNDEKNIPAWIQDHIAKAEDMITQASQNYHEYGDEEVEDVPVDGALDQSPEGEEEISLQDLMEKIIKNKK